MPKKRGRVNQEYMPQRKLTKTSTLLLYLLAAEQVLEYALEPMHKRANRMIRGRAFSPDYQLLYKLIKRGVIRYDYKNEKKFYQLTAKGQLEALMAKARLNYKQNKWDGKWRIVMFDIPESGKTSRDKFRKLLREQGFKLLQASVFISPHPLNQAALDYLIQSKLIKYIRIVRVEAMDSDSDLRKSFHLRTPKKRGRII